MAFGIVIDGRRVDSYGARPGPEFRDEGVDAVYLSGGQAGIIQGVFATVARCVKDWCKRQFLISEPLAGGVADTSYGDGVSLGMNQGVCEQA